MSRTITFASPLLLGFEEVERLLDRVSRNADGYPPYNIERIAPSGGTPGCLRIVLAVAGFSADEIAVTVEENELSVKGRQMEEPDRDFLHRGIAGAAVPADLRSG